MWSHSMCYCNTDATTCDKLCNGDCKTCDTTGLMWFMWIRRILENGKCLVCDNTKCATCSGTDISCDLACKPNVMSVRLIVFVRIVL